MKYIGGLISTALLIYGALAGDIDIGGICKDDTSCVTYCCSNDNSFDKEGKCIEIDDNERCRSRKYHYNIALIIIILLMIVISVLFGFMKKRDIEANESRLRKLKIEAYNDEKKRIERGEEKDDFSNILGDKGQATTPTKLRTANE